MVTYCHTPDSKHTPHT